MQYTTQYTIDYKEAVVLFASLTKGTTVKPFSFEILERSGYKKGIKIFENALDYEIGMKFLAVVKMYKGTGKRPKTVTFAFHKDGVDILSKSGIKIV